jgi:hypothetical protein
MADPHAHRAPHSAEAGDARTPDTAPGARVVRVAFRRGGDAEQRAAPPPVAGPTPYRALFAPPGAPCLATLGEFRPLLAPQLAHPDRLLASHRLACHVEVFEATVAARADALVRVIRVERRLRVALAVLSPELAQRLGRPELHVARPDAPRAPAGVLRQADRLFGLTVDTDPTAAPAPQPGPAPAQAGAPAAARPTHAIVPERFLLPWELALGRDEAIEVLAREDLAAHPARGLLRILRARLGSRGRVARWRARLEGRSPEEQLWGVRPPERALALPAVRAWARAALAAAGHHGPAAFAEWEIYWRRKGVTG